MQYLELVHTKQLCVVHLNFKFNKVSCIVFGKLTFTLPLYHPFDLGTLWLHIGSKDIDTKNTVHPQQRRLGEKSLLAILEPCEQTILRTKYSKAFHLIPGTHLMIWTNLYVYFKE